MPDLLDLTARRVRLDQPRSDVSIHVLAADWIDPWSGVCYRTMCSKVLTGVEGAILTTWEPTCTACTNGGGKP